MAKILQSKGFIIFLIIILVFIIIGFGKEGYKFFRVRQNIKSLEREIEELEKENQELKSMEKYFDSQDFLEKQARLKLNLTKLGEKLIIIKIGEGIEKKEKTVEELSNFQLWWRYFFEKR